MAEAQVSWAPEKLAACVDVVDIWHELWTVESELKMQQKTVFIDQSSWSVPLPVLIMLCCRRSLKVTSAFSVAFWNVALLVFLQADTNWRQCLFIMDFDTDMFSFSGVPDWMFRSRLPWSCRPIGDAGLASGFILFFFLEHTKGMLAAPDVFPISLMCFNF